MKIETYSPKQSQLFIACLHCTPETGRSITCHSTCEKYIKAKAEWEKMKAEALKNKPIEHNGYMKEAIYRGLHKRAIGQKKKRKKK